jgi:hypothetical protein
VNPNHRETLTEAVINALRERLERELRKEQSIKSLMEKTQVYLRKGELHALRKGCMVAA